MHGEDMRQTRSGVKLTWDDYALFPEDGQRHELIDGEHFVTPAPIRKHQVIVMNLGGAIWKHVREHRTGQVFFVPMDVIFSSHDVLEPDLLYYSHERARTFEPSPWIKGVPNLVAEVLSPSTQLRDRGVKRRVYEKFGVDEYWLIDPTEEWIDVLRLNAGAYVVDAHLRLAANDVLRTPLLPEWSLPLREVFEE